MAAVMEAKLDRSPSPEDSDDDAGFVDGHLLAEEQELQMKRLQAEALESDRVSEDDEGTDESQDGEDSEECKEGRSDDLQRNRIQLLELLGKSQLYSSFLADQFKDVVEKTLETASAQELPAKRKKFSRGKGGAGPRGATAAQSLLPLIRADLRDYQLKGVAWLISLYKNGVNGILADEMGLGKTLQTISFISYLWAHYEGANAKYLVVGPLSTLSNWVSEFERFCPDIPALLYHGTQLERESLRRNQMEVTGKQLPVIVTSYEIVMADRRFLEHHQWKLLVVDEGHRLKNFNCKLNGVLRSLRTDSRLLLTGTPLQNNLRELWSLLSFCMPQVFADAEQFLDWFDIHTASTPVPSAVTVQALADGQQQTQQPKRRSRKPKAATLPESKGGVVDDTASGQASTSSISGQQQQQGQSQLQQSEATATMVSRLHEILKPFVLRRVKADVDIGVPPKQEVVLYAEMAEEQRRLTRALIDGTLQEQLQQEGIQVKSVMNMIMQMRKVCNHPDLITGAGSGTIMFPPASELIEHSGKLALLDRLLRELHKRGHRVLIFSQMTKVLDLLEAYLQDLGIEALRIDGSVSWQNRKSDIADFQTGVSNKWIFLLSTRAGGLGINLTAADTVILFDSDWNPHQDLQAMDRCHRIGQTKPVLVFRLVTSNSVENRMLAKADSKRALERIIMKKGAFKELLQSASSTSAEELVQLLNPDRRSQDLAQSGVISDDMLAKILDRSHLTVAAASSGKLHQTQPRSQGTTKSRKRSSTASGKAVDAGALTEGASGSKGPVMPPYPLMGVGYEVVLDEPSRATGLLPSIEDQ